MVEGYGTDDEVTEMLDTFEFFVIPVYNPDGYDETVVGWRDSGRL